MTLVYQGAQEHRDSAGHGGEIGEGDVQWMTVGAGIAHEKYHAPAFAERGGILEMVQLWVNLSAPNKSTPPAYQALLDGEIPRVALKDGAGEVRFVAGSYLDQAGPARTFTPINVWELRLVADHGPFVMNHDTELRQAFADFQAGKFGNPRVHESTHAPAPARRWSPGIPPTAKDSERRTIMSFTYNRLDKDDVALLMVDHQAGLL